MKRLFTCFFTRKIFKVQSGPTDLQPEFQISSEEMGNPSKSTANDGLPEENSMKKANNTRVGAASSNNIIINHDFSSGLHSWHPNNCKAIVVSSDLYVIVTERTDYWQGLEQDITSRVSIGSSYIVSAYVSVSGAIHDNAYVQGTLKLEYRNSDTQYMFIGRKSVVKGNWEKLEGTFSLSTMPDRAVFYLEGPPPGADLLIKSVVVSSSSFKDHHNRGPVLSDDDSITLNPNFEDGLNNWSGRGCKIVLHDSMADGKILPFSGKYFASVTERTQGWNGIQQDITERVIRKLAYEVTAVVRLAGSNGVTNSDVRATLYVQGSDNREQYIGISSVQATDKDWVTKKGKFLIEGSPTKVVVFLEGPPPGTDILVDSFVVKHAMKVPPSPCPIIENPCFGINIIVNSNHNDGTNGWFPQGNCTLSVAKGSPHIIPPMARDSLGIHKPLSGCYLIATNRTQTWMGPAQMITDRLKIYLTYQVSAWVRIGLGAGKPELVNVALSVDGKWVNGGQVEVGDETWHEIGGSFRLDEEPNKVMVYVQGPSSGIDLMVAGLQIFPVDRKARFKHLKNATDKIRKRDVILKLPGSDILLGSFIRVKQTQNSFPFGSCLSRSNIDNEDFVNFFINNFNWAVFGNELKWYWTEPQEGNFNYKDADDLLNFCMNHNIQPRGHCIFWEVEDAVQQWVRNLNATDLRTAVQNRLTGLLTRYKGKFNHYDVNNEMLHGSFYQQRLGKDVRANMFKIANQLDPYPLLFVNDYHVEDGFDARSSPERYIQHILDLQQEGAPIGGIGVQGHIDFPVGPIICSGLDKLGILGLPIWFTEVDVASVNEFVRADDLEVMLRELYAHPSVDGVLLWGFWELFMRENGQLVNAEGDLNEAGRRYLALKEEWLSHAHGHFDDQGQFCFRGFEGSYEVDIVTEKGEISKSFTVEKGEEALIVPISL